MPEYKLISADSHVNETPKAWETCRRSTVTWRRRSSGTRVSTRRGLTSGPRSGLQP